MAENKKRGASRQLTKDDDPDAEEETPSETGTFKKASDEVLAARRIVRVKRTSGSGAQATAPNPFANIQLTVSSPALTPTPTPATDGAPKLANKVDGLAVPSAELLAEASARAGDEQKVAEEAVNGSAEEEKPKPSENGDKGEKAEERTTTTAADAPTSFQQVSSAPNAFGSFTSGTGFTFPTTPFTFGSPGGFNFGSSSSATGSSFTLASSGTGSSFAISSFSSSSETKAVAGFESSGAPSSSSPPVQQNYATVSLQEVATETGEENEKPVFTGDGVLYEFVDKSWKERGKGELKLNVGSEDNSKGRLVMRSKGNFKLLLNAGLFPDIKTSRMDNRSVTFACVNIAGSNNKLATYAIKLREAGAVPEFLELIEQYKGVKSSSPAPAVEEVAAAEESNEAQAPAAEEAPAAKEDEDRGKKLV